MLFETPSSDCMCLFQCHMICTNTLVSIVVYTVFHIMSYSPEIVIGDKIFIKNNNIHTVFQIRSHSPEFVIFRKNIYINHDSSVFYKHLKFKTCFINQEIKLNSTILYNDLTKLVMIYCFIFDFSTE